MNPIRNSAGQFTTWWWWQGRGAVTSEPLPALRARGHCLERTDGRRFTAIECSDFHLLGRVLTGEEIGPVLEQRADCGFNMLRVWTRYRLAQFGIGESTLGMHPDLYNRLPEFLRLCANYGLYVELTAYVGPDARSDYDPSHWKLLIDAVQNQSNVLLELVNENDQHPINTSAYAAPSGVPASHGSNGSLSPPVQPFWSYATFHTNGATEEQRKIGHNAMELWPGPTLTNETSRYPEVGMWSGADLERAKQLAFDSAAGAALLCAGSCFHSVHGKSSVIWDAQAEAVARAWAAGARSVDLAAQERVYVHRIDLETADLLRVYQRGDQIVRIRR